MNGLIEKIKEELLKIGDPKVKLASKRFFKENIKTHGVKAASVHKIAKDNFKLIKNEPKETIFEGCELLFKSNYIEESLVACDWVFALKKQYKPTDFIRFENWIETYITNWATCDTFCNHTIGSFIMMYPDFLDNLKKWTASKNLWKRRAAAVSLIVPAKKGLFHNDIIQISDFLLLDEEDLVQKGYGWVLKVTSQVNEQLIFDYIMANKSKMPRTALRYAIEKMPTELKQEAMKK
ncbi:DNA alkylation repair protein [Lutibacter citreus]|uniref:DNA alkylation repair protein n=1 Tax=Lutibacter citreus TaxID=2138210 RepID=UPI000DBE77E3|nr:DNA alkylation repair protein [Lutibacter citreus]